MLSLIKTNQLGYPRLTTTQLLVSSCVFLIGVWLIFFVNVQLPQPDEHSPQSETSPATPVSVSTAAPLIIYRTTSGLLRACVIPRLCSIEPLVGRRVEFHVPEVYRPFEHVLRECIPTTDTRFRLEFYRGEQPAHSLINTYDVDVLGRSLVSSWYRHFPHLARFMTERVLAVVSLFLSESASTLPSPRCMYAESDTAMRTERPCARAEHLNYVPQILTSDKVLSNPWNRDFFQMLGKLASHSPLVHVVREKSESVLRTTRMECYRSVAMTPELYDSSIFDRDVPLRLAGVQRTTPNCHRKTHVVVLMRPVTGSRSIDEQTLRDLGTELDKNSNITTEWVSSLGDLALSEQVALFQRADILLIVHGAELANALFLRLGVAVIEVMPFGSNIRFFARMLRRLQTRQISFPSTPDSQRFFACLHSQTSKQQYIELRLRFVQLVEQFRKATSKAQRDAAALFPSKGVFELCAKAQKIRFDAPELARLISIEAEKRQC